MNGLHILGTGRCLPARCVTNEELSRTVDTNDEWIASRTGIRQRYFCREETNEFLAAAAAKRALSRADAAPEQVGACIVATFTSDFATPSTACLVQRELGLPKDIPCFDLNAACSGFLYGLSVARGLLAQSGRPYALVIASDVLSRVVDFSDRSTCVLFGDGAGAAVAELSPSHRFFTDLGADGNDTILYCPAHGTMHMKGQEVFRFAVETASRCMENVLREARMTLDDVDFVVLHQANERIIDSVIRKMHAPREKFYINVAHYGNTSASTIPIALDEMAEKGLLHKGSRTLCAAFGGGLTWGGALLEW